MCNIDKGQCYFEAVVRLGQNTGTTTMNDIAEAAKELTRKCAFFRGTGGRAVNIGESQYA